MPDIDYMKTGPSSDEENDSPPYEHCGFVIVTAEDNKWRTEFEDQDRVPEGMVLLRPKVKMTILIAMLVCQSPDKMLMACHVCTAIQRRFPYFLYMPKQKQQIWKQGIRHSLADPQWYSKVVFHDHQPNYAGSYWMFNNYLQTMPDNWNLSAQCIRLAIKPTSGVSSLEANPATRKSTELNRKARKPLGFESKDPLNPARALHDHHYNMDPSLNSLITDDVELVADSKFWQPNDKTSEQTLPLKWEEDEEFITQQYNPNAQQAFIPEHPFGDNDKISENYTENNWEAYLPSMSNVEQNLSLAILSEPIFESSDNLTEI